MFFPSDASGVSNRFDFDLVTVTTFTYIFMVSFILQNEIWDPIQ